MTRARLAAALLLSAAPAAPAAAQMGGYFGQNHVQYKKFEWRVLATEHFDVHYYPEIAEAARMAAQMAERSYARLSRVFNHRFTERKPILVFGSRGDFGQNNVFGDLGEGTGGVTDALRQRNMFFFSTDIGAAEHVLAHEMVHQFQYDIFSRGRAGANLQSLAAVQPPLWLMEGMAEYLSIGPDHPFTDAIVRDAVVNGDFPTIEQMTRAPNRYFPYRWGEAFLEWVGSRWGDEVIGEIMGAVPAVGVDRAFKRHTGLSLVELGEEWREAMQQRYLPATAERRRIRSVASPLLNARRTGGVSPIYIAPALSPDGKQVAYISTGSLLRAEVFLDLYLADATTGKRLARLTNSTLNPEFEELRYAYSQSAFSPDGRLVAFTAQRRGKDVLYLYDVRRKRVTRRLDTGLDAMIGPSFSPDGRQVVFSGARGGFTDLYVIHTDGSGLRKLTDDPLGDLMPQWSPDGTRIAFVSERGPQTDLGVLRFGKWRIAVLDLATGAIEVLPGQDGKNLNPQWAPDGGSIAYVTDRTGGPNLFLYDLTTRDHYKLTDVVGAVASVTEDSPVISWARGADRLALTFFDDGDYTVWTIDHPRRLKTDPFVPATATVAGGTGTDARPVPVTPGASGAAGGTVVLGPDVPRRDDDGGRRVSAYRGTQGIRAAHTVVTGVDAVSVAALLDSAAIGLPDPRSFRDGPYRGGLRPEYVSQPQIGYAVDNFGRGVFGGTTVILSDMVGDRRLALAGAINGRVEEGQLYAAYTRLGGRLQSTTGLMQFPQFFLLDQRASIGEGGIVVESFAIARFITRSAFFSALYPRSRFSRFELGLSLNNLDQSVQWVSRGVDYFNGLSTGYFIDSTTANRSLGFVTPSAAWVSDNTISGYHGPLLGRRFRFEYAPAIGSARWQQVSTDYRRYDPLLFSYLTLATRVQSDLTMGRDEAQFPKYIGRPFFVRGYDRENVNGLQCSFEPGQVQGTCPSLQLSGTRVAFANVELRAAVLGPRTFNLPIALPPVEVVGFFDTGVAWSRGQIVYGARPANYDLTTQRYPLRSYGYGVRLNLFGIALIRWDYSIPLDDVNRKGYLIWTIGPTF